MAEALEQTPIKVFVAASGSGGHLIPALHIMRAIKAQKPDAKVECIGTGKPLEEKIIVENGFTRHIIKAAAIKQRGILGIIKFIFLLPIGVLQCFALFRRSKPDVVVGVGGYVSVLPVVVARLMGIATWAHEAELHPGLANRVLGYFAATMSTAFAETKIPGRAKVVFTGHPVRPELRDVDRVTLGPDAPKRLLVLGGSQGARGLDQAISDFAPLLHERGIEVVHQCRPENSELVVNAYRAAKVKASVVSFIDDMAGAYSWSDVIISRAGAGSVAEILCVNRPTIFVPYPFQQGTHQTDNASVLASLNKALIVEEGEPEFGKRLREALDTLLSLDTFRAMKEAPCEPRGLDAAESIAKGIIRAAN
ncbi:MAG: UDP-N-acetylglucosamine--N-acetylmuramyl-(pentapeptide) pyrophosphoryl-undecaprenol N-acetylglucosamine transferase [Pseudomonadota bacterium]